jgi:hypothetical protein
MEPRAVLAIVDAIGEAGVTLAGVNKDAATAASFAGNGVNDVSRRPHRSRERVSTNSWNWEKFAASRVIYVKQVREIAV